MFSRTICCLPVKPVLAVCQAGVGWVSGRCWIVARLVLTGYQAGVGLLSGWYWWAEKLVYSLPAVAA